MPPKKAARFPRSARLLRHRISSASTNRGADIFRTGTEADSMPERGTTMDSKVAALKKAQNAGQVGTAFPPRFLLTAIMTIATAWTAANPFGPSMDPRDSLNKYVVDP